MLGKALKVPPVRPSDVAFIETAMEIRTAPDAVERAYMARELVQCTLPHSNPGNVPVWSRRNGSLVLSIQPGLVPGTTTLRGYPYGTVPRLLLFWLVTEATRTKSRRVYLGDIHSGENSLAAFMRSLGLDPSRGGPRSDTARLRKAIDTLFGAKITFHDVTETSTARRERRISMDVSSHSELWWTKDKSSPEQSTLFHSWVVLGEHFYEAVCATAVPVDLRILKALKGSSLALDLYAWLCYRAYSVNKAGRPTFITWRGLMEQLGTEYTDPKEFARKAKPYMRKVLALWRPQENGNPGLLLDFERGGIRLHPGSVLSVPEAPKQLDIEDAIRSTGGGMV